MITLAFTLFDVKAQFFSAPFFRNHAGQAVRDCMDLASDLNTTVGRHPNDFHLYQIGSFDDQTGALIPERPVALGVVASFLANQVQPGLFAAEAPDLVRSAR